MSVWISTKKQLPPEKKWVLGRHNRGTWIDREDQGNVNCVVVKLIRGLSLEDRNKMKAGLLRDPVTLYGDGTMVKRSAVFHSEDQQDEHDTPYCWDEFGPDRFDGKEISHWTPIPPFRERKKQ